MRCTWCGHDEHPDAACPRKINVRVYRRGAPPTDTAGPCPCARTKEKTP